MFNGQIIHGCLWNKHQMQERNRSLVFVLRVIICKHQILQWGGGGGGGVENDMSQIFMKLCFFYAYVK